MASVGEAPTLFLRKATGLVKGWSKFDAFLYSFMSVNFVTLGLFFALSVLGFVPNGQILPALLISGVFVTFLVITYAGLISVMPRAGGDYVWQSRVLGGGLAFLLAITGWWFILWYWAPVYANILNVEVLQPLAALFKLGGLTTFLATKNGLFTVCIVTVVLAGFLVSLGMEGYAKVQRVLLLHRAGRAGARDGHHAVRVAGRLPQRVQHGVDEPVRHPRRHLRPGPQGRGRAGGAASSGSARSSVRTLLLIPFLCFWILWPNWGATLYGEVRGASDFKRVMSGMMWGLWVTVAIAVVFILLASHFFGWQWFNSMNLNYWNVVYGLGKSPIPIWALPAAAGELLHPQHHHPGPASSWPSRRGSWDGRARCSCRPRA